MSVGRNSLKIAPGAMVCAESELKGDVTVGAHTVIHPKARIVAEAGPIIIGENNLIEEQTQIINRHPKSEDGSLNPNQTVMIIGNNNVFEVGCTCQSLRIGDYNVVEEKACVGRQTQLSSGCIIGAMCSISSSEELPENTVIFGSKCERRIQLERPPAQSLQLDFLTKILPNYHHLKKPVKSHPPM